MSSTFDIETLPAQGASGGLFEQFMRAAHGLVDQLRQREEELDQLARITERINYGLMLEDILEFVYQELRQVIPYNRIGFSLIDEPRGMVVAHWARSDRDLQLGKGYEAPLEGSTLQDILASGQPRILNDLEAYLAQKPHSGSTQLIVSEGMRSSLTCPLIVRGRPVGFLFFSSQEKATYSHAHVVFFQQIAGALSSIVEKGRLYSELARQKEVIQRHNDVMTHELDMARQVQRALIPASLPVAAGLEIAFEYRPMLQIGGDVLDVMALSDGSTVLFIGDAMGHGVQAALVMSAVKTALAAAVAANPDPPAVLTQLNRALSALLEDCFVTAACCRYHPGQRRLAIALAGHPQPILRHGGSGQVRAEGRTGLPLGFDPQTVYEGTCAELNEGDAVVLFTDGLLEMPNAQGEHYGQERLDQAVARHGHATAADLMHTLLADMRLHAGATEMQDDCTLLVARCTA